MKTVNWCVYIARCNDDTLYTGCTNDVYSRVEKHNSGKGAKYTRGRLPITLIFSCEVNGQRSCAQIFEAKIKKLSKQQKLLLIVKCKTVEELTQFLQERK